MANNSLGSLFYEAGITVSGLDKVNELKDALKSIDKKYDITLEVSGVNLLRELRGESITTAESLGSIAKEAKSAGDAIKESFSKGNVKGFGNIFSDEMRSIWKEANQMTDRQKKFMARFEDSLKSDSLAEFRARFSNATREAERFAKEYESLSVALKTMKQEANLPAGQLKFIDSYVSQIDSFVSKIRSISSNVQESMNMRAPLEALRSQLKTSLGENWKQYFEDMFVGFRSDNGKRKIFEGINALEKELNSAFAGMGKNATPAMQEAFDAFRKELSRNTSKFQIDSLDVYINRIHPGTDSVRGFANELQTFLNGYLASNPISVDVKTNLKSGKNTKDDSLDSGSSAFSKDWRFYKEKIAELKKEFGKQDFFIEWDKKNKAGITLQQQYLELNKLAEEYKSKISSSDVERKSELDSMKQQAELQDNLIRLLSLKVEREQQNLTLTKEENEELQRLIKLSEDFNKKQITPTQSASGLSLQTKQEEQKKAFTMPIEEAKKQVAELEDALKHVYSNSFAGRPLTAYGSKEFYENYKIINDLKKEISSFTGDTINDAEKIKNAIAGVFSYVGSKGIMATSLISGKKLLEPDIDAYFEKVASGAVRVANSYVLAKEKAEALNDAIKSAESKNVALKGISDAYKSLSKETVSSTKTTLSSDLSSMEERLHKSSVQFESIAAKLNGHDGASALRKMSEQSSELEERISILRARVADADSKGSFDGLRKELENTAKEFDVVISRIDKMHQILGSQFREEGGILGRINNAKINLNDPVSVGGKIVGPGTGTSDSIHLFASNGEYVVNAKATAMFEKLLDYINSLGLGKGSVEGLHAAMENLKALNIGTSGTSIVIESAVLSSSAKENLRKDAEGALSSVEIKPNHKTATFRFTGGLVDKTSVSAEAARELSEIENRFTAAESRLKSAYSLLERAKAINEVTDGRSDGGVAKKNYEDALKLVKDIEKHINDLNDQYQKISGMRLIPETKAPSGYESIIKETIALQENTAATNANNAAKSSSGKFDDWYKERQKKAVEAQKEMYKTDQLYHKLMDDQAKSISKIGTTGHSDNNLYNQLKKAESVSNQIQGIIRELSNTRDTKYQNKEINVGGSVITVDLTSARREIDYVIGRLNELRSLGSADMVSAFQQLRDNKYVKSGMNVAKNEADRLIRIAKEKAIEDKKAEDSAKKSADAAKKEAEEKAKAAEAAEKLAKKNQEAVAASSALNNQTGQAIKNIFSLDQQFSQLASSIQNTLSIMGLQQLASEVIHIGGELEKQQLAMNSILGSAGRSAEIYTKVANLSMISPFTVQDLIKNTKQLAAFGVEYDNLYDTVKRLSDISAAVGVDFGRIAYEYGQMETMGYLDRRHLRMFSMSGVPLSEELRKYYSSERGTDVSQHEIDKMIMKREIGADVVKSILKKMTDEGGKFFNMQEVMAESLAAKYANLGNAWNLMLGEMAVGAPGDFLKDLATALTELTNRWREIASIGSGVVLFGFLTKLSPLLTLATTQMGDFSTKIAESARNTTILNRQQAVTRSLYSKKLSESDAYLISSRNKISLKALADERGITKEVAAQLFLRKQITREQLTSLNNSNKLGFTNRELMMLGAKDTSIGKAWNKITGNARYKLYNYAYGKETFLGRHMYDATGKALKRYYEGGFFKKFVLDVGTAEIAGLKAIKNSFASIINSVKGASFSLKGFGNSLTNIGKSASNIIGSGMMRTWGLMKLSIQGVAMAARSLGTAILSIAANPFTWIFAAVGGVVALKNKSDEAKQAIEDITNASRQKGAEGLEKITEELKKINGEAGSAEKSLSDLMKMKPSWSSMSKEDLKKNIESMRDYLKDNDVNYVSDKSAMNESGDKEIINTSDVKSAEALYEKILQVGEAYKKVHDTVSGTGGIAAAAFAETDDNFIDDMLDENINDLTKASTSFSINIGKAFGNYEKDLVNVFRKYTASNDNLAKKFGSEGVKSTSQFLNVIKGLDNRDKIVTDISNMLNSDKNMSQLLVSAFSTTGDLGDYLKQYDGALNEVKHDAETFWNTYESLLKSRGFDLGNLSASDKIAIRMDIESFLDSRNVQGDGRDIFLKIIEGKGVIASKIEFEIAKEDSRTEFQKMLVAAISGDDIVATLKMKPESNEAKQAIEGIKNELSGVIDKSSDIADIQDNLAKSAKEYKEKIDKLSPSMTNLQEAAMKAKVSIEEYANTNGFSQIIQEFNTLLAKYNQIIGILDKANGPVNDYQKKLLKKLAEDYVSGRGIEQQVVEESDENGNVRKKSVEKYQKYTKKEEFKDANRYLDEIDIAIRNNASMYDQQVALQKVYDDISARKKQLSGNKESEEYKSYDHVYNVLEGLAKEGGFTYKEKGSGSTKQDKTEQQRIQNQIRLVREAYSEYQKWYGEYHNMNDAAKAVLDSSSIKELFDSEGFGEYMSKDVFKAGNIEDNINLIRKNINDALSKGKIKKEEAAKLFLDIDKIENDIKYENFKKVAENAASTIENEISEQVSNWDLFKKLKESGVNPEIAFRVSFEGDMDAWDEQSDEMYKILESHIQDVNGFDWSYQTLKDGKLDTVNLKEIAKDSGVDIKDALFSLTESEAESLFSKDGSLIKWWKQIKDYIKKNRIDSLIEAEKIIEEAEDVSRKLEKIEEDRRNKLLNIDNAKAAGTINADTHERVVASINASANWELSKLSGNYFKLMSLGFAKGVDDISKSLYGSKKNGEYFNGVIDELDALMMSGKMSGEEYAKTVKDINDRMNELSKNRSGLMAYISGGASGLSDLMTKRGQANIDAGELQIQKGFEMISSGATDAGQKMVDSGKNMKAAGMKSVKGAQGFASTVAVIDAIIHGINDAIQGLKQAHDAIKELAESRGIDTNNGGWKDWNTFMSSFSTFSQHATNGWDKLKNGDAVGAVTENIAGFASVFTSFNKSYDEKVRAENERLGKKIDKLADAFEKYSSVLQSTGYDGSSAYNKMINRERAYLREVRIATGENNNSSDDKKYLEAIATGGISTIKEIFEDLPTDISSHNSERTNQRQLNKFNSGIESLITYFNSETWDDVSSTAHHSSSKKSIARELVDSAITPESDLGKILNAQYASLIEQRKLVEEQLAGEYSLKDPDDDQIESYKKEIKDLSAQIVDFSETVAKDVFGLDFSNWADKIGDAISDAFNKGEDAVEAFDNAVNDMLNDVAMNVIKIGLIQPYIEDLKRKIFGYVDEEGNTVAGMLDITRPEESINDILQYLARWRDTTGESISKSVEEALQSAEDLGFYTKDTESSNGSVSSSIKGITEETADLLASYINAISADVSVDRSFIEQIANYHLPLIESLLGHNGESGEILKESVQLPAYASYSSHTANTPQIGAGYGMSDVNYDNMLLKANEMIDNLMLGNQLPMLNATAVAQLAQLNMQTEYLRVIQENTSANLDAVDQMRTDLHSVIYGANKINI